MRKFFQKFVSGTSAAALLATLLAVALVGCGDSREDFVITNTNNPVATGALTFNFVVAQGTITVPEGTVSLEFTFFDGLNQTGNITLGPITRNFAATVTITGVPVTTQSYQVRAINANGTALASATGNVTVIDSQTGVVDVTGADFNNVLTPPAATLLDVFVSNAGGGANDGDIDLFDRVFGIVQTFDGLRDEGITVDALGTAFHNGATDVDIISRIGDRNDTFDTLRDRAVTVSGATGIKGGVVIQDEGLLVLADSADSEIHVQGTAAASGSTLLNLTTPAAPWDMTYDNASDRLFVAFTNGTVGVYDGFAASILAGNASGTPSRTITVAGIDNAHGIAYDSATDLLIVSDVGTDTGPNDPNTGTDGEIYVVANGSTANGNVTAQAVIAGSNTELGNPVDIDLSGADLRVAEKANDRLLVFSNILTTTGGNLAPNVSVPETKPEALVSRTQGTLGPDNSDIDSGVTVQNILVATNTSNLAGTATGADNVLLRINTGLTTIADSFDTNFDGTGESAAVDGQGDVFMTDSLGLCQYGRVANGTRDNIDATSNWDRFGGLVGYTGEGKGLDIVDSRGVLIVADFAGRGATGAIHVFGKYGNLTNPIFTVTTTNSSPWDLDYDPATDRLYVATTEGEVDVYDNFLDGANPGSQTADRTITTNGAVNFHGIVYDAVNDVIIVSDVGAASGGNFASDGAIYVFGNGSTASGTVTPLASNSGNNTNLGNPVDIAFDGTNLYVAEKANDEIQRYDNILTLTGTNNIAASQDIAVESPESVSLITGL